MFGAALNPSPEMILAGRRRVMARVYDDIERDVLNAMHVHRTYRFLLEAAQAEIAAARQQMREAESRIAIAKAAYRALERMGAH